MNLDIIVDNINLGYIKESTIHGYGLFAKEDIESGKILTELDGQLMKWNEYYQILDDLTEDIGNKYVNRFMEWNCIGNKQGQKDSAENTLLLVRPFRTKYSFVNHSRTPNCALILEPLRLVAIRDIKKDEELTFDYRTEPLPDIYYIEHGDSYL